METIGIIGAGRVGQSLARLAIRAGLRVLLAGSGAPARVRRVAEMFAPGAEPVWAADTATADAVILAMPLTAVFELEPTLLDGVVVLDATNYWPETDGERADLDDVATSVLVQRHLVGARVVKALNHVAYRDLTARAHAPGSPHRIAIGVSGDDAQAIAVASDFVDRIGFDPVVVGSLADSAATGPRSAVFGAAVPANELLHRLGR